MPFAGVIVSMIGAPGTRSVPVTSEWRGCKSGATDTTEAVAAGLFVNIALPAGGSKLSIAMPPVPCALRVGPSERTGSTCRRQNGVATSTSPQRGQLPPRGGESTAATTVLWRYQPAATAANPTERHRRQCVWPATTDGEVAMSSPLRRTYHPTLLLPTSFASCARLGTPRMAVSPLWRLRGAPPFASVARRRVGRCWRVTCDSWYWTGWGGTGGEGAAESRQAGGDVGVG